MADNLKNALIRVWSKDLGRNYGNVVIAEVLRRRVDAPVPVRGTRVVYRRDFPGAVLIDAGEALQPIADAFRRNHDFLITIAQTDELIWTPTNVSKSIADYWTIELIPYVDHLRTCLQSDTEILKAAHDDN